MTRQGPLRQPRPWGARGRPARRPHPIPTFAAFAETYIRSRARDIPASISRVRDTVKRIFGDVRIDQIGPAHIEGFRTRRLDAVAPGTVKQEPRFRRAEGPGRAKGR
jgi:hypothetical protein